MKFFFAKRHATILKLVTCGQIGELKCTRTNGSDWASGLRLWELGFRWSLMTGPIKSILLLLRHVGLHNS